MPKPKKPGKTLSRVISDTAYTILCQYYWTYGREVPGTAEHWCDTRANHLVRVEGPAIMVGRAELIDFAVKRMQEKLK